MQVSEQMTKPVWTCRIDDSLEHAARLLWEHDCGCLPVTGEHGHLHGMITDRDICMAAYTSGRRLVELQVREAMAIDVVTTGPADELRTAELLMRERGVRRLPVIDEQGCVVGVLSCNDLMRWVDDGGTTGRMHHDAVHLVRTLATLGAPRSKTGAARADREPVGTHALLAVPTPTRREAQATTSTAVAARAERRAP